VHWHKQSLHPVCAESARDSMCCAATTLLGRESPDWVAALVFSGPGGDPDAVVHWHKQSVHPVCAESARDSMCCAATTLLGRESPDWVAALVFNRPAASSRPHFQQAGRIQPPPFSTGRPHPAAPFSTGRPHPAAPIFNRPAASGRPHFQRAGLARHRPAFPSRTKKKGRMARPEFWEETSKKCGHHRRHVNDRAAPHKRKDNGSQRERQMRFS